MSQNTLDFEIIGLPNRDGYDLKITSVVGADSVKINHEIGRAIVSTSKQTEKVVILYQLIPQNNPTPQTDHEEEGSTSAPAAEAVESSKVIVTIENTGKDLIFHTSNPCSGADGAGDITVRTTGFEALNGKGKSNNGSSSRRHVISHDKHGMTLIIGDRSLYKCSGCKESGIGHRYICNEECSYILHPDCRYHEEEPTHEFLTESTLKFFEEPINGEHRSCVACGWDIKGYFYHCDVTNKSLHPCCLTLEKTIRVGKLKFRLCEKLTTQCSYCYPEKKENMDKCWCYSSKWWQDSQVHVSCMKDAIIKCLEDEMKKDNMNTMDFIMLKITELLNWAKMLLKKITQFLKSSKPHLEDGTQFLKRAKVQLDNIILFLIFMKEPLKKFIKHLKWAENHLNKIVPVLGSVIIILEGLLCLFSGEFSAHCQPAEE